MLLSVLKELASLRGRLSLSLKSVTVGEASVVLFDFFFFFSLGGELLVIGGGGETGHRALSAGKSGSFFVCCTVP